MIIIMLVDNDVSIMNYLCLPTQQAVQSYDGSEIPLFLRFINLMLNDATVQLDEGLQVGVGKRMWWGWGGGSSGAGEEVTKGA